MPLDWDYTEAAASYDKRPGYADAAIHALVEAAGLRAGMHACDVGAGTGILTALLAARGLAVAAVEPNAAMWTIGVRRTPAAGVCWHRTRAEATGLPAAAFDVVTYGSSFNVVDRPRALAESARILRSGGWLACLWNHRDLDDPLQRRIEALVRHTLPDYDPGARREDPSAGIDASGLFRTIRAVAAPVTHHVPTADWLDAWQSHVTLRRQAGTRWRQVLDGITTVLAREGQVIAVRYTTRLWMARLLARA
jgi:SAM-dependent methyltransferase